MTQGIREPVSYLVARFFLSLLPGLCRLSKFYYLLLKKKKNPGSDGNAEGKRR